MAALHYFNLSLLFLAVLQLHSSNSQKISHLEVLKEHDFEKEFLKSKLTTFQEALNGIWTNDILQEDLHLTDACNDSIKYILEDISRLTPLLDATGKPGAGIMGGNLILSAAFDECFNYNYTAFCSASEVYITKDLHFRVELCVPKYCSSVDVAGLINATEVLSVANETIYCTDSKSPSYSNGAITMIVVSIMFATMVVIGTVIDALITHTIDSKLAFTTLNSEVEKSETEKTPLLVSQKTKKLLRVNPLDFITAFSLFKTVPTLLATSQGPSVITSLNGLRVISMFWVILGHTFAFAMSFATADNPIQFFKDATRFSIQAVENAYFSVDSFFFLSGVLVAYLTLREMKKKDGRFPAIQYYIHRYLRITPTYAFVLFFASYLGVHFAYGPFHSLHDVLGPACSKYWWTNLLYINNLYPWKLGDQCLGWGWYLANDMQFYIIAPIMFVTAYYYLPAGLIVTGVFLVTGFSIDATLVGVFDFQASQLSGIAYNYTSRPGASQAYSDAIYGKPWDRISPYIVGLALGYILYKKIQFNYNKFLNLVFYGCLWIVATFVAFWLVYGLYFIWHGHIPHTAENIIYITFSRFLWACCLALVVYACHNGYGWFINSFLSMKLWTPLARLTFNAYLLHPVIIVVIYGQLQNPLHYTDITITCFFIAFIVLSYAAAGVMCVAVELPLGTIELLIFQVLGLKSRESQRQDTVKKTDES